MYSDFNMVAKEMPTELYGKEAAILKTADGDDFYIKVKLTNKIYLERQWKWKMWIKVFVFM